MSRLLVCSPEHFSIDYEINPWMRLSNTVNAQRAQDQWRGLVDELEHKMGATLERMTPVPGLPDLVFTANAGTVHANLAVPSRFRHAERQREEPFFESWFQSHGFELVTMEEGIYF